MRSRWLGGLSLYASGVAGEHEKTRDRELTVDEELLLWLGDEPPTARAADAERIREIAGEFARGFDALAGIGRAVCQPNEEPRAVTYYTPASSTSSTTTSYSTTTAAQIVNP